MPGRKINRREALIGAGAAGLAVGGTAYAAGLDDLLPLTSAESERVVDRANVVVVMIDSLRKDHVGAFGGQRAATPSLDALARQSVRFPNARHEAMPTIPVRRSLVRGRRVYPFRGWEPVDRLPPELGWQGIGPRETLFTEVLARRGYLTGYVTDNPHILLQPFDDFRSRFHVATTIRGQLPLRNDVRVQVSQRVLRRHMPPERNGQDRHRIGTYLTLNRPGRPEGEHLAARVFTAGMEFLDRATREGRPFALIVDAFDVHEPWDPPVAYLNRYGGPGRGGYRPIHPFKTPLGRTDELRGNTEVLARRLYAAEVTFVDAWVGRFLSKLDELGLRENTWVVLTSDHGVQLGERGVIGKDPELLHRELIDVPFMIRHPGGLGAGRQSNYFASAHDIGPTLLRGTGAPVPAHMNGVDLGTVFAGRRPRGRRVFTSAWGPRVVAGDG
ncbi:MAG TPA: sulfatase, partial [Thermoleophilaceae bacterium]|nr:sulfatase [Thermoleophilaceae bacterium]